ncbi:hypothetical protein [Deferrisoma camini]|uniref:hypothetical protein n=1 Tax=Deferrisoma camini TaxID=1035120 RepID=UPI00046D0B2B|nr:hypothetical protein [Deferrisoma camini]NOY43828.1 hypothetical protein [Deltaproteobacteria bacterium]
MARRTKQTYQKRAREKARQERRMEKQARRAEARERKAQEPPRPDDGEDPDIAGIVPGPQPLPPQFRDDE